MKSDITQIDLPIKFDREILKFRNKIFKIRRIEDRLYVSDFYENTFMPIVLFDYISQLTKDFIDNITNHFAMILNDNKKNSIIMIEVNLISEIRLIDKLTIKQETSNSSMLLSVDDMNKAIITGFPIFSKDEDDIFIFDYNQKCSGKIVKKIFYDTNTSENKQVYEFIQANGNLQVSLKMVLLIGNIGFQVEPEPLSIEDINSLDLVQKDIKYYLNLWDKYNEKEKYLVFQKARSIGIIKADSYELERKRVKLYFSDDNYKKIKDNHSEFFIVGDDIIKRLSTCNTIKDYVDLEKSFINISKGQFHKDECNDEDSSISFVFKSFDNNKNLNNIYLALSLIGNDIMFRRRDIAKKLISTGKAGLPFMNTWFTENPLPHKNNNKIEIDHQLFVNRNLTNNQIEAIKIICNTPDVAIIQGPPGTGKTTVINEAVIQINAFNNNLYGKKANNLLSGFRHETVTNLANKVNLYGLPAIKIGKKRDDFNDSSEEEINIEEKVLDYISNLLDKLEEKYSDLIDRDEIYQQFISLKSNYILFQNSLDESILILKEVIELPWFKFNHTIENEINNQIRVLESKIVKKSNNDLVELLYRLPTNKSAFDDNYLFLVDELNFYLESNPSLSDDIHTVIESLRSFDIIRIKHIRREMILKHRNLDKIFLNNLEKEEIIKLLNKLDNIIRVERMQRIGGEKIAILEYIESINENPYLIRNTMMEYIKVLGATNQQALSFEMFNLVGESKSIYFDNVFIDEAATSMPLDLFIPMSLGKKRVVFVGDHKQLPFVSNDEIIAEIEEEVGKQSSDKVISRELKDSLFEHLFNKVRKLEETDGIKRIITLNNQFRMHPKLGSLISKHFYHEEGGIYSPRPPEEFTHNYANLTNKYAHWLDVKYDPKSSYRESNSRKNILEANVIAQHISQSLKLSSEQKISIGVISLYKPQVRHLGQALEKNKIIDSNGDSLHPNLTIEYGTVDAFQGKEFDIVYLTLVYTFDPKNYRNESYSRLVLPNLMNVAMSRQKKMLIVVGNMDIFKNEKARELVPALCDFKDLCSEV